MVPDPDGDLDLPVTPLEIPTDLIQIFDLKQETLARSLGDGHRVIHGVAGSGKTMVLLYRCSYLAAVNPEKPILVLCFNVTLAARLKEAIVSQSLNGTVDVRHFHDWCKHQLKSHNIRLPQFSDNYITDLENTVREAISSGRIPGKQYSSILIDEGHDFEPEWFKMLTSTLDEQDSLLLLYDDAQNLYGSQQKRKKFSFKSVGIKAQGRTSVLKTNYRNTVEVLNLAYEFAKEVMQPNESDDVDEPVLIQPQSAGRHGHSPQLLACGSFADEVKQAISLVQKLHSEGVPWNEMGILYRVKFMGETIYTQFQAANLPIEWLNKDAASRSYQPKLDSIKLMTMHSCKGLEFSSVIIPGLGYLPNQYSIQADEARLLYVAMTRSTERLILSYHQESAFVKLLQEIALNRSLATYPLNCQ